MIFIKKLRSYFSLKFLKAAFRICGSEVCETEYFNFRLFDSPSIEWTAERIEMLVSIMSAAEAELLRRTSIRETNETGKIEVFVGFTFKENVIRSSWINSVLVQIVNFSEGLEHVVLETMNSKILFHGNRDDMMDFETRTRLLWEIWNVADPDFP